MHDKRKTKIVATIGPATESGGAIRELIEAGADVFRLNFSHGTHEVQGLRVDTIRKVAAEMGKFVAIMQDIQGPKIRVGEIESGVVLVKGSRFVLTPREVKGNASIAHISYDRLADDIPPGFSVLLDDGKLELKVTAIDGRDLVTEVVLGGPLSSHKGVNFPGCALKISVLTEKDKEDLLFGAEKGVDLVAASFVQYPSDVLEIKDFLAQAGKHTPVISKIEQQEAVKRLVDIIAVSDGVLVARGDLGVEMLFEELPQIQKRIIREANLAGKPVITATQMLDSMVSSPRPTRAEVSDVANAILDGTDAVMLSNETAMGAYPVMAVETMARIAIETEKSFPTRIERPEMETPFLRPVQDAIGHAATHMAPELGAAAIITPTSSGSSARMVAKYRPKIPVIAVATSEEVCRRLSLVWGVYPLLIARSGNLEQLTQASVQAAMEAGFVSDGDLVIVVSGIPVGVAGSTNLIKVEIVATVLGRGLGLGKRAASGIARSFKDPQTANESIGKGDILVVSTTDAAWVPAMAKAAGVVVRSSGLSSHTALVGLELGIPVILGVDALEKIPEGAPITLDPVRGLIFRGMVKI